MNERVAAITAERIAAEARAVERAASLPPGEYHADGEYVANWERQDDRWQSVGVIKCESHWDACLVLLALGKSS